MGPEQVTCLVLNQTMEPGECQELIGLVTSKGDEITLRPARSFKGAVGAGQVSCGGTEVDTWGNLAFCYKEEGENEC